MTKFFTGIPKSLDFFSDNYKDSNSSNLSIDSFRSYTIDDFYRELKAIEEYDFDAFFNEFSQNALFNAKKVHNRALTNVEIIESFVQKLTFDTYYIASPNSFREFGNPVHDVRKGFKKVLFKEALIKKFGLNTRNLPEEGWTDFLSKMHTVAYQPNLHLMHFLFSKTKGINQPLPQEYYAFNRHHIKTINSDLLGQRQFEVFINTEGSANYYDPSIPNNALTIRILKKNKAGNKDLFINQNFNTGFIVTNPNADFSKEKVQGFLDIEGVTPNVLDAFTQKRFASYPHLKDTIFVYTEEYKASLVIIDSLKMMMNTKSIALSLSLLTQAFDAAFKVKQNLDGDFNNNLRKLRTVTIIPENKKEDYNLKKLVLVNSGSNFYNPFNPDMLSKRFSDVFASGESSTERIAQVTIDLKLIYSFLSETSMSDGNYAIDKQEYEHFLSTDNNHRYERFIKGKRGDGKVSSSGTRSNMFMKTKNFKKKDVVVVTFNNKDLYSMNFSDRIASIKKILQRQKLIDGPKFLFNYNGNSVVFKGDSDTSNQLIFDRSKNYHSSDKEDMFKNNSFESNILVGFIEKPLNDYFKNQTFKDYFNSSLDHKRKFSQYMEGAACEGLFNHKFLKETQIVPKRSEKIECSTIINIDNSIQTPDVSESLRNIIKHLDNIKEGLAQEKAPGKPYFIKAIDGAHRDEMISSYTAKCKCGGRMIEGDSFSRTFKRVNNLVNLKTKSFYCPTCSFYVEEGESGFPEVKPNYFGQNKPGLIEIVFHDYKMTKEGGYKFDVDYYFPLSSARLAGPDLTKVVAIGLKEQFVGKVKSLELKDPITGELKYFNDLQLDALLYKNNYKGKDSTVIQSLIRLNNAVFGLEYNESGFVVKENLDKTFSISSEIEKENPNFDLPQTNKLLSNFKKSKVEVMYYHPEKDGIVLEQNSEKIISKRNDEGELVHSGYELTELNMYVGLMSVTATEVSQEFLKVKNHEDPRKFTKEIASMWNQLGWDDLVSSIYKYGNIKSFKNNIENRMISELMKIYGCLSNLSEINPNENAQKDSSTLSLIQGFVQDLLEKEKEVNYRITNLTPDHFRQDINNRIGYSEYIDRSQYEILLKEHPLLTSSHFVNGSYVNFKLIDNYKKGMNSQNRKIFNAYVRLPSRDLMIYLVDKSFSGSKVRLSRVFSQFLALFENISTSNIDNEGFLTFINSNNRASRKMIDKLKEEIESYLFGKEGAFTLNTSINMVAVTGKQLCISKIPHQVAVVSDDYIYKKLMSHVFLIAYPEGHPIHGEQDWSHDGWCWYESIKCFGHRDPVGFLKQVLGIDELWSIKRANQYCLKNIGLKFSDIYSGNTGIYINTLRAVINDESDNDGDQYTEAPIVSPDFGNDLISLANKYYEDVSNMSYFQSYNGNENIENLTAKMNHSKCYSEPSFRYLEDESKSLFEKYKEPLSLDLTMSQIDHKNMNVGLFSTVDSKKDVGPLTLSNWFIHPLICFLETFGPQTLKAKLNYELKSSIYFIFNYILFQLNGTRGIKSHGAYSKLTLSNIVRNAFIKIRTGLEPTDFIQVKSRELFMKMLEEYDAEYSSEFSSAGRFFIAEIVDGYLTNSNPNSGGDFYKIRTFENGEPVELVKPLDKLNSNLIDPNYRRFLGIYYVLVGLKPIRYTRFTNIFGPNSLLEGLYTGVLKQIPFLKVFYRDMNSLIGKKED